LTPTPPLTPPDAPPLAMHRSLFRAATAALLPPLARRHPEAAIAERILLGFAALKLLVEDFRFGHAATIAVALVAYGTVLLIISRKRESIKRILVLIALLALHLTPFPAEPAVPSQ